MMMRKFWETLAFLTASLVVPCTAVADTKQETSSTLESWCTTQMASWRTPAPSFSREVPEDAAEAQSRYQDIARDAIQVAYDPEEAPLFRGEFGRAKTLALILSIADSESGYRKDVDTGVARGDHGKSWCLMQVQLAQPVRGKTPIRIGLKGGRYEYFFRKSDRGFGGEDLVSNRQACFRVALHIARESFQICSRLPMADRLAIYTSGGCYNQAGREASRIRVNKAMKWFASSPAPFDDSVAMENLAEPQKLTVNWPRAGFFGSMQ